MSYINTKLLEALHNNQSVEEVFRQELETAINELISIELTEFLNYEKYDYSGRNSGNSRNGSYNRTIHTTYGDLTIKVPRDRNGEFSQQTITPYKHNSDTLEDTIIHLYKKGITTREISDLIEKMYGHYYTPQTISNITKAVEGLVKEFHNRQISNKYIVVYCDATYLNVRRDSVAKEALHVILGINSEGEKEVLDYALYPSESSNNYREMLENLKERGLEQVLLFATDGLKCLSDACLEVFPNAKYQPCWTHISRNVMKNIRNKDKAKVMQDLKKVYNCETEEESKNTLFEFVNKYQKLYPKATAVLDDISYLFTFYAFPSGIRKSIYTTNLIENLNKNLKRGTKRKEQFPNEDSLERYVCSFYCDYNRKYSARIHKGFNQCKSELNSMFK
jgi:transposase-like protein